MKRTLTHNNGLGQNFLSLYIATGPHECTIEAFFSSNHKKKSVKDFLAKRITLNTDLHLFTNVMTCEPYAKQHRFDITAVTVVVAFNIFYWRSSINRKMILAYKTHFALYPLFDACFCAVFSSKSGSTSSDTITTTKLPLHDQKHNSKNATTKPNPQNCNCEFPVKENSTCTTLLYCTLVLVIAVVVGAQLQGESLTARFQDTGVSDCAGSGSDVIVCMSCTIIYLWGYGLVRVNVVVVFVVIVGFVVLQQHHQIALCCFVSIFHVSHT
uniref:Uncharacterized protein n=1 Tax=Glossina brevipalpis TaxID=37001 RepID=A0A1A9WRK6_9MUSC